MTGLSRTLGTLCAAFALTVPAFSQDLKASFDEGVDLLSRGRNEEALEAFRRVLAADPDQEQALELWQNTDHGTWLEILTREGEFELIARRLMGLASAGRAARQNDAEAIRGLVAQIGGDDPIAERAVVRKLSSEHGEYAVPYMLGALGDPGNEDRRVAVMHALTQMNTDVVPPLIASLASDDAYLRRMIVTTLGYIGDARAAGPLALHARIDSDGAVQRAATEALGQMGVNGDPLRLLLQAGEDYQLGRDNVLADYQYSDVVWRWNDGSLEPMPVPRAVYNDEMARKCYRRALAADASSRAALAGIARSYVTEIGELESLAESGEDVAELLEAVRGEGHVAVLIAGVDAIDAALQAAVSQNDVGSGVSLIRTLGEVANGPTPGLRAALASKDGALRSEAAISLGRLALSNRGSVSGEVVSALGEVAGREVLRIAMIIDSDAARSSSIASALEDSGMLVTTADSGALGLGLLRRLPGVDVLLVAESLPDITTQEVVSNVKADSVLGDTPVVIVAADVEAASELYGDQAAGAVSGPGDLATVEEALSDQLNADREQANALSVHAADVLGRLAGAGQEISGALDGLARTLVGRPDEVTIPAARALGIGGTSSQAGGLMAVLADDTRSDEVRAACGHALASIFSRGAGPGGDQASALSAIVNSDAALAVRAAAAHALGALGLSADDRAQLLSGGGAEG